MKNPNHPKKGDRIKVDPIRNPADVQAVKRHIQDNPRNLLLFTLGINTGYRANELLSLKVRHVKYLEINQVLEIYQSKTKKYRRVIINESVYKAIHKYLNTIDITDDEPLFRSQQGWRYKPKAISVQALNLLIKRWCADCGLQGNFGTHTLRKTWGYHQRKHNNVPLHTLMFAFGHSNPRQTMDYLCMQEKEVEELFKYEI